METKKIFFRTLGNGARVYFETNKYRVNESIRNNSYILNVGEVDSIYPIENIISDNLKELLFYADYLESNWQEGLCHNNVNEVIKRIKNEYNEVIK